MKEGPKEQRNRELREARFARKSSNPFEDAARGRDPALKSSSEAKGQPQTPAGSKTADGLVRNSSGAAVESRGGTVTGTAGSDKERASPEVRRGYNGPPSEASSGGVERPPRTRAKRQEREAGNAPVRDVSTLRVAPQPVVGTSKRGRPKKGEERSKPWEALGISKASYYRRKLLQLPDGVSMGPPLPIAVTDSMLGGPQKPAKRQKEKAK